MSGAVGRLEDRVARSRCFVELDLVDAKEILAEIERLDARVAELEVELQQADALSARERMRAFSRGGRL